MPIYINNSRGVKINNNADQDVSDFCQQLRKTLTSTITSTTSTTTTPLWNLSINLMQWHSNGILAASDENIIP